MIEEIKAVKLGLEIFGVEKRLKELEARPRASSRASGSNGLSLDQTTPQSVTGGYPTFEGITIKAGYKLILDG